MLHLRSDKKATDKLFKQRRLKVEALEARRLLAAAILDGVEYWQPVEPADAQFRAVEQAGNTSFLRATDYKLFQAELEALADTLADAPLEFQAPLDTLPLVSIPNPNGTLETFRFAASPIMAPELAAKFPEIMTFAGQSVDDAATNIRFDLTPRGFHAQVLSPSGSYYVDPYFHGAGEPYYASYFASGEFDVSDLGTVTLHAPHEDGKHDFNSESGHANHDDSLASRIDTGNLLSRSGTELRVYRAAVAATGEYVAFHGGTVLDGQAAIVTAMNRVNGVYENELSIRMELVSNNDLIVYTDANSDPYTNNNAGALLGENQNNIDTVIGNQNYDIGHVFSTGAGGLAALGSVGIDPIKAQAATGLPAPTADPFYIDFVAHEMGHQFGGNHTFNGDSGACAGNANLATAMEPGSGSTIQAYAGICGDDDIQPNSDPYFHSVSFDEMIAHVDTVIPQVGQRLTTGNAIPAVDAGPSFVIPANTPFVLSARGSDIDAGDTLTFNWEQRDTGPQQDVNAGDNGLSPLFRSWTPTTSPQRYFPRLPDLLAGTTTIGETLPTTNRTLNFRATVRDNRIGGAGVSTDDTQVQVFDTGATFAVTSHAAAATLDGLTIETITWDVAGTDVAPIASDSVTIRMSVDGGLTFPFTLAARTPNTGTADVVIPNVQTDTARFMVQGADNAFFNISTADVSVTAAPIVFDLGNPSTTFTENEAPQRVAPSATIDNPSAFSLENLSIAVSFLSGSRAGDSLGIDSQGSGAGQIAINGSEITYEGVVIGTYSDLGTSFNVVLNDAADDAAAEALLRSVVFQHVGDNPGSQDRTVEFLFGGAQSLTATIGVVPTNDSPTLSDAMMAGVAEDTTNFVGNRVSDLFAPAFADVDDGSSMAGIGIVGNFEIASEGTWHFSSDNGSAWQPIGNITDLASSLVLSADSHIAFLPATNYFGSPSPLSVRALDDTYDGGFSNSSTGQRLPLDRRFFETNGAASTNIASLGIEVTNVNDPPTANASSLSFVVAQDQPIDRQLAAGLFTDIDSPTLEWSLNSNSSAAFPPWLSFDPASRTLSGTPQNRDVGTYSLVLTAKDSDQAEASIPVSIRVDNVNDAPIGLRLAGNSVPENTNSRIVGELFATDPDPGDAVNWSVSDSRFEVRENRLWVRSSINFEAEQVVNLTLTATDTGVPSASAELEVGINIIDVNEFFPVVEGGDFEIEDGLPAGSLITTVRATDADTFDTVSYRLQGGDQSAFSIDPQSGEMRIVETADFRTQSSYRVFVEAYDDGEPSKARTVQFDIHVTPINQFPPTVVSPQAFTVAENSGPGIVLGTFAAQDEDGTELTYELLTSTNQLEIDPATGQIKTTATPFDFELSDSLSVEVRVTENESPNRSAIGTAIVSITNVNDPPDAIELMGSGALALRKGYVIPAELLVIDPEGPDGPFTFSTTDARFEFIGSTLKLRDDFHFDRTQLGDQQVLVTVTEASDPTISATLPLTVEVLDAAPWQNISFPTDVTRDGNLVPRDALLVVNELNSTGGGALSNPRSSEDLELPDFDVNGDGFLSPIDALIVINALNEAADGEAPADSNLASALADSESAAQADIAAELWYSAFLDLESDKRKDRER